MTIFARRRAKRRDECKLFGNFMTSPENRGSIRDACNIFQDVFFISTHDETTPTKQPHVCNDTPIVAQVVVTFMSRRVKYTILKGNLGEVRVTVGTLCEKSPRAYAGVATSCTQISFLKFTLRAQRTVRFGRRFTSSGPDRGPFGGAPSGSTSVGRCAVARPGRGAKTTWREQVAAHQGTPGTPPAAEPEWPAQKPRRGPARNRGSQGHPGRDHPRPPPPPPQGRRVGAVAHPPGNFRAGSVRPRRAGNGCVGS